MTPQFKEDFKEPLLEVFRSGEYEQITGALWREDGAKCSYCAEGMIMKVAIDEGFVEKGEFLSSDRAEPLAYKAGGRSIRAGGYCPLTILKSIVTNPSEVKSNTNFFDRCELTDLLKEHYPDSCAYRKIQSIYTRRKLSFTDLNDELKMSFEQIAKVVEELM